MVSTRRTASSLSAQAAPATGNADDDDGATGAESRLTPTPAERRKKTAAAAAATTAKSKSNAAAAAHSAPSSPPCRRAGTSSRPVPEEEEQIQDAIPDKTASSPLRKSAQGRGAKRSSAIAKVARGKAAVKTAATFGADSSSDDDEAEEDGLACLAEGMLDALRGLSRRQRKGQDSCGSESDDNDDDAVPPSTARNVDGNDDDGGGASSSSDSEVSEDSDGDEGGGKSAAPAPVNVSWAPTSLWLPLPATATPGVELLARKAKSGEQLASAAAAAAAATTGAAPRPSRRSSSSSWFDLPTQTLTPELKTDLRLLRLRGAMDPTRHYKSADTTKLPSRFHVGTVVEAGTDFYSSRLSRSERGQTLTRELLKDRSLSAQRKRRFGALQEAAAARGRRGGGKGAKERKTSMPRLKKHRVRPKH